MDRREEAANLLVKINELNDGVTEPDTAIKAVCQYFDKTKNLPQSEADKNFLKYAANAVGIPHYYDLLVKFGVKTELEEISLKAFSALFYESSLHVDEHIMLHKYQKEILSQFQLETRNRFFLSASTSFGKTFLVYEIIKKMRYKNVVLIFPAIALLSENLERIYSDPSYSYFKDNYKIHTLSEPSEIGEKNIFIYTPEPPPINESGPRVNLDILWTHLRRIKNGSEEIYDGADYWVFAAGRGYDRAWMHD